MEDKKTNSKNVGIIVAVIAVIAVVAACIGGFFLLKGNYKTSVNKFAEALKDEDKLDKFVDKYMDARAMYAIEQIAQDSDLDFDDDKEVEKAFKKEYKDAKKSDYEKTVDELKDAVKLYSGFYKDLEVKEIGKLEDGDGEEMPKFLKQADVTFKDKNDQEIKFKFAFYKNKIVFFSIDYSDEEYSSDEEDYNTTTDDENTTVEDTNSTATNEVNE